MAVLLLVAVGTLFIIVFGSPKKAEVIKDVTTPEDKAEHRGVSKIQKEAPIILRSATLKNIGIALWGAGVILQVVNILR